MTTVRGLSLVTVLLLLASACGGSEEAAPLTDPVSSSTPSVQDEPSLDSIALPRLGNQPATQLLLATEAAEIALPSVVGTSASEPDGAPVASPRQATPVTVPNSQGPSATQTSAPTQTSVAPTTPGPGSPPGAPPFPASMAAIRGGDQILLIDTTTGNSATVAQFSLIVDEENRIGPVFPFSVDVDPVAVGVRYDTCCEPQGAGTTFVDLVTGSSGQATSGGLPSVSPNGATVALSNLETIEVINTSTGSSTTLSRSGETWFVGRTAWAPDGRTLAVEVLSQSFDAPAIALVDTAMSNLDDAVVLEAPKGSAWTLPSFRYDGTLVVLETRTSATAAKPRVVVIDLDGSLLDTIDTGAADGVLDIDHDVSGYWLLLIDSAGDAHWAGPDAAGRLPGGGFTSASW